MFEKKAILIEKLKERKNCKNFNNIPDFVFNLIGDCL